jgi:hypothetical protein
MGKYKVKRAIEDERKTKEKTNKNNKNQIK